MQQGSRWGLKTPKSNAVCVGYSLQIISWFALLPYHSAVTMTTVLGDGELQEKVVKISEADVYMLSRLGPNVVLLSLNSIGETLTCEVHMDESWCVNLTKLFDSYSSK